MNITTNTTSVVMYNDDGDIEFIAKWDKALSTEEIEAIKEDPFQMFKKPAPKSEPWLTCIDIALLATIFIIGQIILR